YRDRPLRAVASPTAWKDLVFMQTGDGDGSRRMVAAKVRGPGETCEMVWEKRKGSPYVPTILVHGDHLFTVSDGNTGSMAGCLEAATGKELWSERLGGSVSSSPVLIDGKVYVVSEDGTVYVFAAATKFELLARNPLNELVIATPAVADGRLYIRGEKHLFCIGRER